MEPPPAGGHRRERQQTRSRCWRPAGFRIFVAVERGKVRLQSAADYTIGVPASTARPKGEESKGFKNFVMRGNLVELAVAFVMAAAFAAVVTTFTCTRHS